MGWKISCVIINSNKEIEKEKLLNSIGFHNLKKIVPKTFEEVMLPPGNTVYITKYKGNWIICEQELPIKSFEENTSYEENTLSDFFPDTEICSIALQSTVNFWGYSVTKNNQKLRVKGGTSELGTFIDFGKPLKEEEKLLSKSKIDENGNRFYNFDEFTEGEFTEDQVGENFVFELGTRYFGKQLDSDDELLFDTNFEGYSFSKTPTNIRKVSSPLDNLNKNTQLNTKFLKYLLFIVVIIIICLILKNT
ncbi:hypothetical protein [Tenacibaculum mesophilum]|uniref:hypothetical protein n=1 Tax=Tenacibaculum mesophilum TaxID=104268 RepID=UPI003F6430AC